MYQLSNQSYEKYADKIKNRLNRLKEHIQLNNQDAHTINIKSTFYENVDKNTFINLFTVNPTNRSNNSPPQNNFKPRTNL